MAWNALNPCLWLLIAALLGSGLGCGTTPTTLAVEDAPTDDSPTPTENATVNADSWQQLEILIAEQKFRQARELAATMLGQARQTGDQDAWALLLIRRASLTIAVGGFEAALEELRDEDRPAGAAGGWVVDLVYGHAIAQYVQAYGWDVRQRERQGSRRDLPFSAWTLGQFVADAGDAYGRAWASRDELGARSTGSLPDLFHEASFPESIRGTLRDSLSYLWAEFLANSSLWTPAQSNDLDLLDLEAILDGSGEVAEGHPLLRLGAVLTDLERWHRTAGRQEAAFEARRQLVELLGRVGFTKDGLQERITAELRRALEELGHDRPWWSMGMATLARRVLQEEDPQARVRARALARRGAELHADGPGAVECRAIIAEIEAPTFRLAGMVSDGLAERSLRLTYQNLETVYFRAYRFDLDQRLKRSLRSGLLPRHQEVADMIAGDEPAVAWTEELEETVDFRLHAADIVPPLEAPGVYMIVASAAEDFGEEGNLRSAVYLTVGEPVLVSRLVEGQLEVEVRSGHDGRSLSGVRVDLYRHDWRSTPRRVSQKISDARGRLRFRTSADHHQFLVARRGDEVAFDANALVYYGGEENEVRPATLVTTDRAIYRPGQRLQFKVVAYEGKRLEGRFQTLPGRAVTVTLTDANGDRVGSVEVTTNGFGSASGELTIPPGRLLGSWYLSASPSGGASVQVEEYKRPTFEVTFDDPEVAPRLRQPVTFTGRGRYYFGLPVTLGEVRWSVTRRPLWPLDWRGWLRGPQTPAQVVAGGVTEVGSDGTFSVRFTPQADDSDPRVTYRYELAASLTDESGETRDARRGFRLGALAVEGIIDFDRAFQVADEPFAVAVQRQDLDGTPRAGAGEWSLHRLDQPAVPQLPGERPVEVPEDAFRTAADQRSPRHTPFSPSLDEMSSWRAAETVGEGGANHGEDGRAEIALPALPAGAYRLIYRTEDPYGGVFEDQRELIVAGAGSTPLAVPLVLETEHEKPRAGESLQVFAHSGFAGQEMVFEVYRGHQRVVRRVLEAGRDASRFALPIGLEDRGGLSLRLTAVRDHQLLSRNVNLFVPWDDRRVDIELETFREELLPGSRETWKVRLAGADGEVLERGAAELLAFMYDRSLDLFRPHQPVDVLDVYPVRFGPSEAQASVGQGYEIYRREKGFSRRLAGAGLRAARLKVFDGFVRTVLGRGARGNYRSIGAGAVMAEAVRAPEALADELTASDSTLATAKVAAPAAPAEQATEEAVTADQPLRSDFRETAFWYPHLEIGDDGVVEIEVVMPEALTEWRLWLSAITRDLRGGTVSRDLRTAQDLMVRPAVPRFLREGDRAVLEVLVNNGGDSRLEGELELELLDPVSGESVADAFGLSNAKAAFAAPAGGSDRHAFSLQVPPGLGEVQVRVRGRAAGLSDGELRPVPVLPGRLYLSQSRFTALRDADRQVLRFAELAADDDPSRRDDSLSVTVDGQLFYGALAALPYLIDYPYECTEQTLNRFVSTGILSSLFEAHPAISRAAAAMAERDTRLEPWEADDPNRRLGLEETPWLVQSRGGPESPDHLIKVLDPRVAREQRETALARLTASRTAGGAFPWWPGGPPSPYMTLYVLQGLARALEFGIEVPKDLVTQGWRYLRTDYDRNIDQRLLEDCCWDRVTFLAYVLSSYPDESWTGGVFSADDRALLLDRIAEHWQQLGPRARLYGALALHRGGRPEVAEKLLESVFDSAQTTPDEGTFWSPEERSWLWHRDTIETHAFALRTLLELAPEDDRRHGLVQWLFLNRQLSHWKSTRATAEVLYALTHYLRAEGQLAAEEAVTVTVGPRRETFEFDPAVFTGTTRRLAIAAEAIDPATMAEIAVEKTTPGLAFASATWHFSTEKMPSEGQGDLFHVERRFFRRLLEGDEWTLQPLAVGDALAVGDSLEVHLAIASRAEAEYVHLRDPRGAGFEPERLTSGYRWDLGLARYEEVRDSGTNFFFERLPRGEYVLKHRLRVAMAGEFKIAPATLQSMYAPEFTAYSAGAVLPVE
ncbi:MAG: MG2 domain-containing protein [Acidobacteriota bacterium]